MSIQVNWPSSVATVRISEAPALDLDAQDAENPRVAVADEYASEVFEHLQSIESSTMPDPTYMDKQPHLIWEMRDILVDWMNSIHLRFRFLSETLFLAVNILDRFLSRRIVLAEKLQLVGTTALFIAAKFEEKFTPCAQYFVDMGGEAFTGVDLLKAEEYMLRIIEWNLTYPSPITFLRRLCNDQHSIKVCVLANYLCEIGTVEWQLLAVRPSLLAAASVWLGRLILGYGKWGPNLVHYSTYSEETILPVANLMLTYILKPMRHESFWKKYAANYFWKASIDTRKWALKYWKEGDTVSLTGGVLPEPRAKSVDQLAMVAENEAKGEA